MDMPTVMELIEIMFLDYQSLTVVILVNTFGLLLVVGVKKFLRNIVVLVLVVLHNLLHMLAVATIVNQLLGIMLPIRHIISMTLYRMEQDALIIVVITLHNLGSIVSWLRPYKMILKYGYVQLMLS